MSADIYALSARDYLLKSAEGEKFEYREPRFADGYEDGPFGDYSGQGMKWIGVHSDEVLAFYEHGIGAISNPPKGRVVNLFFEEDEFSDRALDLSDPWRSHLLIATPRDPRGPFTVSVYKDFEYCGFLTGQDVEEFAIYLVENCDYGAIRVDNTVLKNDGSQRYLKFLIIDGSESSDQGEHPTIISPKLTSPSELQWEPRYSQYDLKRAVTWDEIVDVLVEVENSEFAATLDPDGDSTWFDGEGIWFVPDVWKQESKNVFVFWDDTYVGRIQDRSLSDLFFQQLVSNGHSIGFAERGYAYRDESGKAFLAASAAVRDYARVDWDQVAADF